MTFPYTRNCKEDCELILNPVPGAKSWPRRLVCERHGYPGEQAQPTLAAHPEAESPNDYVREIASPADVFEIGGKEVSQY